MAKLIILTLHLVLSLSAIAGEKIQSDCMNSEMKALGAKSMLEQIAADAKITGLDCTVFRNSKGGEKLLTLFVLDTANGVESRVAVFARQGFTAKSNPLFKSEPIGFDSFPMFAKGTRRLIFTLPSATKESISFYTMTQTSADDTQVLKREFNLETMSLSEVADHAWKVEHTAVPKIYFEKGKWRAILKGKIVDL